MSFALANIIDEEFITNPDVYFVFLLRKPQDTIISFYLKHSIMEEDFSEWLGYKPSYDIFQKIIANSSKKPLILFSEELSSSPESTIKKFCEYVQIPFLEESLTWKSLDEEADLYVLWHETKKKDAVTHWHGNAINSRRFTPLTTYEVDQHGFPTFGEVQNPSDREKIFTIYEEILPYYQFFQLQR